MSDKRFKYRDEFKVVTGLDSDKEIPRYADFLELKLMRESFFPYQLCPVCEGRGAIPPQGGLTSVSMETCPKCNGERTLGGYYVGQETDWKELRNQFFVDCVRKGDHDLPEFKVMPHNVFEWFKKKINE